MKIFDTKTIKELDAYTIEHKPIASFKLMERAADNCERWICSSNSNFYNSNNEKSIITKVFCGLGNNGGDGLLIANLMASENMEVEVYVIKYSDNSSKDNKKAEALYKKNKHGKFFEIKSEKDIPKINPDNIIIDAIFGSGLNKPIEGLAKSVIDSINSSKAKVISIDVPSGMFCDECSIDNKGSIVRASHTLTFELPKLCFMFPENYEYIGDWHVLPIGLSQEYIAQTSTKNIYLTEEIIKPFIHYRKPFSHKGDYGHALVIAGSKGKMGAAVLAARAGLRAGAGLLTAYVPRGGEIIIQTSVPEAMALFGDANDYISSPKTTDGYDSVAIGPGIGNHDNTKNYLKFLIQQTKIPLIIDADAINILGENKTWLSFIPQGSIFTPHPKEFERLVGKSSNNFERMKMQKEFSFKYQCYVILKGAHTCISTPDGTCYFNSTGNPGMATAGSGDVLTGILAGLFAQGYSSLETCLLGVFLHGLAGDITRDALGEEAMISGDIIANLGNAFKMIKGK
jgi:ADP-dependent NAD(P)H-hydrate dehydratase / NAD(P)H-hydrate epimerase